MDEIWRVNIEFSKEIGIEMTGEDDHGIIVLRHRL
jgi:hypothetical protein